MVAKYPAPVKLTPTIVHPCVTIALLLNLLPVSQIKWPAPLTQWKVSGHAIANFAANFAPTGKPPNAATKLAESRCKPRSGAARYAAPKQ